MTVFYQETDTKYIVPLPNDISYLVSGLPNETSGVVSGSLCFMEPSNESSKIIYPAKRIISKIDDPNIKEQSKKIISIIWNTLNTFQDVGVDINHLPPLRPSVFDDGSIVYELIFSNFRIGFSVDHDYANSGWYLVTKEDLGNINAEGYFKNIDIKKIVTWLFSYVINNS